MNYIMVVIIVIMIVMVMVMVVMMFRIVKSWYCSERSRLDPSCCHCVTNQSEYGVSVAGSRGTADVGPVRRPLFWLKRKEHLIKQHGEEIEFHVKEDLVMFSALPPMPRRKKCLQ
jgi:hypothetical protein